MSVVAVILTSIKIEKEVNLLKKGIQNEFTAILMKIRVVNYLDTLITGCVKCYIYP
jgi:hypothetical protein